MTAGQAGLRKMKLLDAIDNLKTWKRGGERAPHKPLLLLYALAKYTNDPEAKLGFSLIEDDIHELLNEFWKIRPSKHHVNDPFWRLQNDKIWQVEADGEIRQTSSGSAYVADLKRHNAVGFFSHNVAKEIRDNPNLVQRAVQKLLDEHFPETLHMSLRESVGLFHGTISYEKSSKKIRRDPKFRENVLHAYGYSCAVCGFNLRVKTLPVGLEAAHIKWHQYGGPDTENNGLALCATHHKLLDSGVLTLSEDYRVILSKWVHSPDDSDKFIEQHQEREIRLPTNKKHSPGKDYIRWHRKEVFKEPEIAL